MSALEYDPDEEIDERTRRLAGVDVPHGSAAAHLKAAERQFLMAAGDLDGLDRYRALDAADVAAMLRRQQDGGDADADV